MKGCHIGVNVTQLEFLYMASQNIKYHLFENSLVLLKKGHMGTFG
jgi:hypothetical protein